MGVLVVLRDSMPDQRQRLLEQVFDAFYITKSSGLGRGYRSAVRSSKRRPDETEFPGV